MTDLIDLLPPTERLYEVFKKYMARLEEDHVRKEKRLDRCFEEHRRRIHRSHLKIQHSYKMIFEELVEQVKEDKDIPILEFMESAMRAKDRGLYEKVVRTVMPSIESVEKEGGHLEISCKRHEAGRINSGSCLYPGDKYFSFFDEFMDGFDDYTYFHVGTESKDEKEKRCKKDEGLLEHFALLVDPTHFSASVRVDVEDLLARGATSVPDILLPNENKVDP